MESPRGIQRMVVAYVSGRERRVVRRRIGRAMVR
jgi:hypothetical protein